MTDRRDFLRSASLLAALGALGGLAPLAPARAATGRGPERHQMHDDGSYPAAELAKPAWTLGVVQSRVRAVRPERWRRDLRANLEHMLGLIDKAFYYGPRPDLLFFHEFPLTGWAPWTRRELLQFCIEIPGEETEAIAAKAREHGCWIVFGAYARDRDWPNHVLSITTIMNERGEIVDKHWKARNIKGVFPGFELFTTTIYDVLDRYVEMYGLDAVIPVTRSPLGNLATSSIQREPELFRAMAIKGAEVILRTASGGFNPLDIAATSLHNQVYTAICNNAVSPDNPGFFDDAGGGGSAVYGPDGRPVAEARSAFEQLVTARIPIAEFRARHRQPVVHMELYRPVFEAYVSQFGPNLFRDYLPSDLKDAARYLRDKSRWR
ncbi:MAG: nitrilase-related carbon-nitrogen hydrolase [Xanthomonadales bacterium]|nr:nitrilase-related carbon-nitrogen hydrolase [Xanthomonadales bacterium]